MNFSKSDLLVYFSNKLHTIYITHIIGGILINYELNKELGFETNLHPMFEQIEDDRVMSPEEISDLLGLSKETVRRWCRTGKLQNYNFGGKYIIVGSDFKDLLRKTKSDIRSDGMIN